eukprot:TRINITY_DN113493_c0_g1_i1.p1 TRINITY_DN113493_c0_g1~~TRINITY_DN113493_c0_g1_i1.p1  ORF type:complete len:226 (+),score=66.50 TRINITY_DN113493_c0_g1_i1:99-680(+)
MTSTVARILFTFVAALPFAAGQDALSAALDEDFSAPALNLIQGHARKIVKGKKKAGGSAAVAAAVLADDLSDFDGLSLAQTSLTKIPASGSCDFGSGGARRVSKKSATKVDPALFAAVEDGLEESAAALSLMQKARGSRLKGDECHEKKSESREFDAVTDQDADAAATVSLLQQEPRKIRIKSKKVASETVVN